MNNQGIVFYKKSKTPGTLDAVWHHSEDGSGIGKAVGNSSSGFEGKYIITYFDEQGNTNAVRDLIIEKEKDYYHIKWMHKGALTAEGIGIETDGGLTAGWQNIIGK